MISNVRKNILGTVSFDGKFGRMREVADFIVYPMAEKQSVARIQSDFYCGTINLENGDVSVIRGAYSFSMVKPAGRLDSDELAELVAAIRGSAPPMAGSNGVVYCNNSGAAYAGV